MVPVWVAVICVFAIPIEHAAAISCFTCTEIAEAKDCPYTQPCAADEICFTRSIVTSRGRKAYRLGCESIDVCEFFSQSNSLVGRRDQSASDSHCRQCCGHDKCNAVLCSGSSTIAPQDYCIYKGRTYTTGETWTDGCAYNCTCEDGHTGMYRCADRCPKHPTTPPYCRLVYSNGCCSELDCTTPPLSAFCNYKGKSYKQGDTWKDGCDYKCTCVDADRGFYQCHDLCSNYSTIPANCTLVSLGGCCKAINCTAQHGNQGFCHYKGQYYNQSETWKDGCDYKCTCVDADRDLHQCRTLCVQFQLPKACTMKPPEDGKCCPQPSCPAGYVINFPPNYVPD